MARTDVYTRIPLDRAAAILGIDPLHFNSVVSDNRPEVYACDDIWYQYPSQNVGQASREDLAIALRTAEDRIFDILGYPLIPIWIKDEVHPIPKPYAVELGHGYNSIGQPKSVVAKYGEVISGGTKAVSLIDDNAVIVYSDPDGDGYDERATVTVNTTVTAVEEIHIFYPGKDGRDVWEIRPITVSISGGVATITFRRELAVLETLIERYGTPVNPTITVDGDDDANFLTAVDVYRVYTDTTNQAVMYAPNGCYGCDGSGCTVCGSQNNTACLYIRNPRLGIVAFSPATWDEEDERFETPSCIYPADYIKISYRAGKINHDQEYPYSRMDPQWERGIVYYAASLLDREVAGCENTHNIWNYLNEDLAKSESSGGTSISYSILFSDFSNPLGTTRAALDLWRLVKRHRLPRAR